MTEALHVTDHAVIRYLERAVGLDLRKIRRAARGNDRAMIEVLRRRARIDVRAIRQELAERASILLEHDGANGIQIDGVTLVRKGNAIVTVEPTNEPKRGQNRK